MPRKSFLPVKSVSLEENNDSLMLHYYHIDIYNENQKLYKIMCEGHKIELIHKKELRQQEFKPDDKYHLIRLTNEPVIAYYH